MSDKKTRVRKAKAVTVPSTKPDQTAKLRKVHTGRRAPKQNILQILAEPIVTLFPKSIEDLEQEARDLGAISDDGRSDE